MHNTARVQIVKELRERGPLHLDELSAALPGIPRRSLEVRLSELVNGHYPWLRVRRICSGVYDVVRKGDRE